jgi:hypothetical protein
MVLSRASIFRLYSLLSLADKSGEDFVIAGCLGFGEYEEM